MIVILGPCTIQNFAHINETAKHINSYFNNSAQKIILRGGCWKPRTYVGYNQGLGEEGIPYLFQAARDNNLAGICVEVMSEKHLEILAQYTKENIPITVQIGSRNMQNYSLLKELNNYSFYDNIVLKRGYGATVFETIGARSYIQSDKVILCERGIRTTSDSSRFTLDIAAIPTLKEETGCKVIVDPSHAAGKTSLVTPLAKAGIAAGADGLMIETMVTNSIYKSPCDAAQAYPIIKIPELISDCISIDFYNKI